jgi:hypothetical protein
VPPEDPEDWTQPLTWLAAIGMIAAPALTLVWFIVERPADGAPGRMTLLLAVALVAGAALTGATQIGASRAFAGTLGAALFGALGTVILGVLFAGERQVGVASPTLSQAFIGGMAGLAGAGAAATLAATLARLRSRWLRVIGATVGGGAVALLIVGLVRG